MDCPSVPAFLTSLYHAAWCDLRTDGRDDRLRVLTAYTGCLRKSSGRSIPATPTNACISPVWARR